MIRDVTARRVTYADAAASLRGRHAADRRGDRPRRGAALYDGGSAARTSPRTKRARATTRMNGLRDMNSLTIYRPAPGKGAIIAFEMKGAHAHDVATVIDRQGVAVRAGTHCASRSSPAMA